MTRELAALYRCLARCTDETVRENLRRRIERLEAILEVKENNI